LLEAVGITKAFGARKLFGPLDFRLDAGERMALVGSNGSGKTTLLRILAGEEHADSGSVRLKKGLSVGYLPQELDAVEAGTLLSFVEDVAEEIKNMRTELRELETRLGDGETDPETLSWYGHLQSRFEELGGYRLHSEARRILAGLGFKEDETGRPLSTFSGGWRMRALLARILLRHPDVILLDEPTNHLDIVSLEWLENFIRDSKAGFLIVSHDVNFLDRVVNGVLALEAGDAVRTKGNYTRFTEERELRLEQQRAAYDRQMRRRAEEERFIERFRAKNTKARQVQSRVKRLEKEETLEAPVEDVTNRPAIRFPQPERSGKDVARLEGVAVGYGDKRVYENLNFQLHRGDKTVLIGPNGAGKSTLMKLLAGAVKPDAGKLELGYNVTVSYFSQHQMDLLKPRNTVLEEILSLPGMRTEREARSLLGGFLFSGDAVDKKVEVLSGGEKSRLVLARLLCAPGNLLLMDEPTNHLDIEACGVLKNALAEYQGTLVVITHDRDLINRVATKVVYVEGGECREYIGNFDDYLRLRAVQDAAAQPAASTGARAEEDQDGAASAKGKDARRRAAQQRDLLRRQTAPLRAEVERLEAEISRCHARLAEVEGLLVLPEVYGDPEQSGRLARERNELDKRTAEITDRWGERAVELETLEERLRAESFTDS
jgi:ATP-binding cassette subfamily F protein 3